MTSYQSCGALWSCVCQGGGGELLGRRGCPLQVSGISAKIGENRVLRTIYGSADLLCPAASCGPVCLSCCKMGVSTFGLITAQRKFHQEVPSGWGWQALEATKDTLQWVVCLSYSLPNSYPDTFSRAPTVAGTPLPPS